MPCTWSFNTSQSPYTLIIHYKSDFPIATFRFKTNVAIINSSECFFQNWSRFHASVRNVVTVILKCLPTHRIKNGPTVYQHIVKNANDFSPIIFRFRRPVVVPPPASTKYFPFPRYSLETRTDVFDPKPPMMVPGLPPGAYLWSRAAVLLRENRSQISPRPFGSFFLGFRTR